MSKQQKITVINSQTRILRLGKIQLLPGLNFVDKKEFEVQIKKVEFWLKAGIVEVVDETEKEGQDPTKLSNYNARKAVQLVKDTVDGEILNKWLKEEDRQSVIEAIDKQLKKLEAAMKEKKEDK